MTDELHRVLTEGPWTFRGDIVAVAQVTSHLQLSPPHVTHAGLLDYCHGPAHTWSNKQAGSTHIAQRLHRALATICWTMAFSETTVFHLLRFNSDHLPILLRTDPKSIRKKLPFRCENWWALRESFLEVCQNAAREGVSSWRETTKSFKRKIRRWLAKEATPDRMLSEIESKMITLNGLPPDLQRKIEESEL